MQGKRKIGNLRKRVLALIERISSSPDVRADYIRNPASDFTRKRKLPLSALVSFMLFREHRTNGKDMCRFFGPGKDRPSTQAFIKAKKKILHGFWRHLLQQIRDEVDAVWLYRGRYRLLAADGSDVQIFPDESDQGFYIRTDETAKGYAYVHLNAL